MQIYFVSRSDVSTPFLLLAIYSPCVIRNCALRSYLINFSQWQTSCLFRIAIFWKVQEMLLLRNGVIPLLSQFFIMNLINCHRECYCIETICLSGYPSHTNPAISMSVFVYDVFLPTDHSSLSNYLLECLDVYYLFSVFTLLIFCSV